MIIINKKDFNIIKLYVTSLYFFLHIGQENDVLVQSSKHEI